MRACTIASRSAGRGRLPAWVVRMRSVLLSMARIVGVVDELDEGEMLRLLLEACPQLQFALLQLMHEHGNDPDARIDLLFPALTDLMLDMLLAGDDDSLRRVFDVIERLNHDGNAAVQRYATLHLLDSLQQIYTPSGGAWARRFIPTSASSRPSAGSAWRSCGPGSISEAEVFD